MNKATKQNCVQHYISIQDSTAGAVGTILAAFFGIVSGFVGGPIAKVGGTASGTGAGLAGMASGNGALTSGISSALALNIANMYVLVRKQRGHRC